VRPLRAIVVPALLVALIAAMPAQEMPVPTALQVPLLVKVLGFDRALASRLGAELRIVVAYQPGFRASREAMEEIRALVEHGDAPSVGGKRVRWVFLPLDDDVPFGEELLRHGAAVAYLTPLRAVDIAELGGQAGAVGVLTTTGVPEYVGRGVAVGFGLRGGRARILISLRTARSAGADFGAQFLHVVDLVEE